jgi:phosphoribosylformylglycinamidine synthase
MAFAGYCSVEVNLSPEWTGEDGDAIACLFAEEVGWVLEVKEEKASDVLHHFQSHSVFASVVGSSFGFGKDATVRVPQSLNCLKL